MKMLKPGQKVAAPYRASQALRIFMCTLILLGVGTFTYGTYLKVSAKDAVVRPLADETRVINATAINGHGCDTTEWHFVINQIADNQTAPQTITITWDNGETRTISLTSENNGVAHYRTTLFLDARVVSATAVIYEDCSGRFNLSHGPCGGPAPTITVTPTTTPISTPTVTPTTTPIIEPTATPTVVPTTIPVATPTIVPTQVQAPVPTTTSPAVDPTMAPVVKVAKKAVMPNTGADGSSVYYAASAFSFGLFLFLVSKVKKFA